jgi:hypothetical protein
VVQIEDLGISPVDFGISQAQKWALVDAGRVATHALLDRRERRRAPVAPHIDGSEGSKRVEAQP